MTTPPRENLPREALPYETLREVARLAGPAIAQSLLHTFVFLVDRAMLGRHSSEALASMQISGPVVWSLFSVLSAFAVGTVALVGRAVGKGDRAEASATLRASLLLALGLGSLATLLGIASLEPLLAVFPAAGVEVHAEARPYLTVSYAFMPVLMAAYTCAMGMSAAGNTKTPFLIAVGGNLVNVALNYVLIFGEWGAPRLGAEGAAIASAAAMCVELLLLLYVCALPRASVSVRRQVGAPAIRDIVSRMARISVASLFERIVQHVGFLSFVAMIGWLGAMAMAANQALVSVESISFMTAEGFGIAAAAVVAQRLGAKQKEAATLAGILSSGMAVALLGAFGLIFFIVPELLLGAFSDDPDIVAAGLPCLYVGALAQPFMGAAVVLSAALRGAGETRSSLVVMVIGGLCVRLGATYMLGFVFELGLVGVWWGSTLDWIVRALLLSLVFARGRWKNHDV